MQEEYIRTKSRPYWLTESKELEALHAFQNENKLVAVKILRDASKYAGHDEFGLKECKEYIESFTILSSLDQQTLRSFEALIERGDVKEIELYLSEVSASGFLNTIRLYRKKYSDKGAILTAIQQLQSLL